MKPRPLSPHLQIYRPQMSSSVSLLHRAAGLVLVAGLFFLVCFLAAAASGPEAYAQAMECVSSTAGQVILLGLTVAFFFYFLAEIRYLAWAFGYGFSIKVMDITGYLVFLGTAVLTALVWCVL